MSAATSTLAILMLAFCGKAVESCMVKRDVARLAAVLNFLRWPLLVVRWWSDRLIDELSQGIHATLSIWVLLIYPSVPRIAEALEIR